MGGELSVAGIADGDDDCTATAQSAADSRAFQNFRQRTGQ
jgi:hypothetical protein